MAEMAIGYVPARLSGCRGGQKINVARPTAPGSGAILVERALSSSATRPSGASTPSSASRYQVCGMPSTRS
jgi:hypothetical protein